MNKQFIIGIIAIVVIGIGGGWFYFSSQKKLLPAPEQAQEEAPSLVTEQEKAVAPQPEPPKPLTTIEKVTARSFAEKILKLSQNRDYSKVYDLLTDEDKAAISRTEYVKQATETSGSVTITSWQIKEVLEEKDGASVQYVLNYESVLGGGSETDILTLVQKSGKWFLSIGAIDIKKAVIKGLGDEVVLATIKFKVNSVRETQTISSSGYFPSSATAREGTKFVVVDLAITNITKEGFLFPDEAFILTDNQDRKFETYDDTILNIDNHLDVRKLSPSITERGVVVYEIPTDAMAYGFVVVKSGTNEVYKVVLK